MGIDLNTVEEEEDDEAAEPEHGGGAPIAAPQAAAAEGGFPAGSVCLELWHACAGRPIALPRKGSVVVYLPQGHLEHFGGGGGGIGRCNVPPHVFCRVIDVKLHADPATDEVYAQLSLVAESEEFGQQLLEGGMIDVECENDEAEKERCSSTRHMFCKTLTASDTSTHGGFSVPRRAAEDCFPQLDYKLQRPSQELIAKDLHGVDWRFRHIYRGQPRRHLLTTGWSSFVNRKKLVSGDAVLFIRGEDGVLRLGIRRAAQLRNGSPFVALYSQNSVLSTLTTVANAVSTKSGFHIYYNPRASSSEFIVPYWKFMKSFSHAFSVGMRFKTRYESEDSAERRCTGLVTGIGDMDPLRWPGSKWRCLLVRWDDKVDCSRQNRVSPWEIEPIGSVSGSHSLSASSSKRIKICLPTINPDFPVPNGVDSTEAGEYARFHKVLQGQEFMGFKARNAVSFSSSQLNMERCSTDRSGCSLASLRSAFGVPVANSNFTRQCSGFGESIRFDKVLQGQEFPSLPPFKGGSVDAYSRNGGFDAFNGHMLKSPRRGFTTVCKQGSIVDRVIDLSKFDGYDDLISELERLFNMEGMLSDPNNKWHVVYTDDEDEMMLVGMILGRSSAVLLLDYLFALEMKEIW
uniref:Auxin response factor n=1 Tax=Ananas comosus var. bracteatus TaxID=296719 RepID=A0A6V7PTY1_ANACO|nr:unnamed protein product [Ananas comosus var. bracteatus]